MTEARDRTLEDAMASLREAVGELRSAVDPRAGTTEENRVVTEQLKADISRLGEASATALNVLGRDLEQQRETIGASIDRERINRATSEIQTAIRDLAGMASIVAAEIGAAAASGVRQADPEISRAIQALDDVLSSASTWVRTVTDPAREQAGRGTPGDRPPLDDL
jgi:hypothetical protein